MDPAIRLSALSRDLLFEARDIQALADDADTEEDYNLLLGAVHALDHAILTLDTAQERTLCPPTTEGA